MPEYIYLSGKQILMALTAVIIMAIVSTSIPPTTFGIEEVCQKNNYLAWDYHLNSCISKEKIAPIYCDTYCSAPPYYFFNCQPNCFIIEEKG